MPIKITLLLNCVKRNTSLLWKSSKPANCYTILIPGWKMLIILAMRSIRECRPRLLRQNSICTTTSWNQINPQSPSTHIGKISKRALNVATPALKSSLIESYHKDWINYSSRSKRSILRCLTGLDPFLVVLLGCSRVPHPWKSRRPLCLILSYQPKDSKNLKLILIRKPWETEN